MEAVGLLIFMSMVQVFSYAIALVLDIRKRAFGTIGKR